MKKHNDGNIRNVLPLSRRGFVAGGLAAGIAISAGMPRPALAQSGTIRADVPDLDGALADLHKKALDAGQTSVLYYGNRKELHDALNPAFQARFPGIEFKMEPYEPMAGAARVLAELSRGPSADLFEGSFLQGKAINDREQLDTTIDWRGLGVPEERIGFDGAVQTFHFLLLHAYNTKVVSRDELPKKNADFLDPKWKGKLASNDFQLTAHLAWHAWATKDFDGAVEWAKKLREQQQMVVTGTLQSSLALVTQGDKPVHVFGSYSEIENNKRQGATIDAFGTENMGGVAAQVAVLKKARNPIAATLLGLWMQTDEAQGLLWDKFFVSWGRGNRYMGEFVNKNNIDVAWETRENYVERAAINGKLRKALGLS